MADSNDKLKQLNDGGYNNLLLVALIVVTIWLFVNGVNKSRQQAYLNGAGTDKHTQEAQALRDAMNRSGIKLMMDIDGTDVDLIMQTAAQITDYAKVADAYRVLYGSELTIDLQNELSRTDLQKFWNIVYKQTTPTGASTTVNTNVGKTVTCTMTTNIRIDKAPYGVESDWLGQNKQAKAGEVLGTYVTEGVLPDLPNKGNRNVFVRYEASTWGIKSYHWVLKSAVMIK